MKKLIRTSNMKGTVNSSTGDMYIGKFVAVLSDSKIDGLDEVYYVPSLPGYFINTVIIYNKFSNSFEGRISNHTELESRLNVNRKDIICGSVEVGANGRREVTFDDESKVTPELTLLLERTYKL